MIRRGRVWKFGDDVDTDVMLPGKALRLSPEDSLRFLFEAVRGEGWTDQLRPGDLIVGGHRFGAGSARPVAIPLVTLGVGAVLATSMPSLFQRNCVNAGLLALVAPGITDACEEGHVLEIDTAGAIVRNVTTGVELIIAAVPALVAEIVEAGGLMARLETDGYFGETTTGGTR